MQNYRVSVPFDSAEYEGVIQMARLEYRDLGSQIRFIVREVLEDRGLLGAEGPARNTQPRRIAARKGTAHATD